MPALRSSVLNAFHDMFMVHNPLATTFRQAASSVIGLVDGQIDSVTLSWHGADDSLKFEVASVIEHDGLQRNIVVRVNDGQLRSISDGHPLYHALAYPLLFPTGASGWHYNMSFNDRKISLTEYMRFMLMHRDHSSHIQRCERLALEFYCDAFAQVEARNLAFHRLATQQAKYVKAPARSIMESTLKYTFRLLSEIAPATLRPYAGANVDALTRGDFHNVVLPNLQDVINTLNRRHPAGF
jgi:hypothetical protein